MGGTYVAVDLGTEAGCVVAGTFASGRVALREIHSFTNRPVRTPDGLHWDILSLYAEVLTGLCAAGRMFGGGEIGGLAEACAIARASVEIVRFEPFASGWWDEAQARLLALRQA